MYQGPGGINLVVNPTTIGRFPEVDARLRVGTVTLRSGLVVSEVIPNPPRTRLNRNAEARGCLAGDGLGMLVNEDVIGIRLWEERDPRPDVMRRVAEAVFGR